MSIKNDFEEKIKLIDAGLKADLERDRTQEFKSNFEFLNQHNGLRPGKLHVLAGSRGTGKSTLVRSLIVDFIKNNPESKVGWWLSEETNQDAKKGLISQEGSYGIFYNNVFLESETDLCTDVGKKYYKLTGEDIDFFIYDNLSTSKLYKDLNDQIDFIPRLKALAIDKNIPVLLVTHTTKNKTYNDMSEVSGADIMGSSILANMAEFLYVIHEYRLGERRNQFLRVEKHRGQNPDKTFFRLNFSRLKLHHTESPPAEVEEMAEVRLSVKNAMSGRNKK